MIRHALSKLLPYISTLAFRFLKREFNDRILAPLTQKIITKVIRSFEKRRAMESTGIDTDIYPNSSTPTSRRGRLILASATARMADSAPAQENGKTGVDGVDSGKKQGSEYPNEHAMIALTCSNCPNHANFNGRTTPHPFTDSGDVFVHNKMSNITITVGTPSAESGGAWSRPLVLLVAAIVVAILIWNLFMVFEAWRQGHVV